MTSLTLLYSRIFSIDIMMKRTFLTIFAFIVGIALAAPAVADQQAGEMTLDVVVREP